MNAHPRTTRAAALAALGLTILAAAACGAPARRRDLAARPPAGLVTADAIRRMNVTTAWDVIRRSGFMVSASVDRNGRPSRLHSRRGRSSILLGHSDTPLVLLDGVRTSDYRVLENVPARALLSVRYLTAIEATVSQGTGAGGGLIEVTTRSDPD
jgi:hypothetical protein